MATVTQQKMKFVSRPWEQRVGLIPMSIAMSVAWTLAIVGFAIALPSMRFYPLWSWLTLMVVSALAAYLLVLSSRWIKDSQQSHELVIDGDLLHLSTYDHHDKTTTTAQISLKDVVTAEYYEPRDMACLLMRGGGSTVEIPLWAFGPGAEKKIVDYVRGRGLKVIGIPNDIVI